VSMCSRSVAHGFQVSSGCAEGRRLLLEWLLRTLVRSDGFVPARRQTHNIVDTWSYKCVDDTDFLVSICSLLFF
jgi:hypothetical protein